MPEAILAGPDGKPAIDAETGQPITMEEMLRRRGIMAYKGVVSPLNMGQSSQAAAASAQAAVNGATVKPVSPAGDVDPASIAAAEVSGPDLDADGDGVVGNGGVPAGINGELPAVADAEKISPTDEVQDADGNWWPVAAMLAAGATMYGISKLNRRPATVGAVGEIVDQTPGGLKRVGPTINSDLTRVGPEPLQIGAEQRALPGPVQAAPVSEETSLTNALANRKNKLPNYHNPVQPSSRQQNAARQANNSRVQPAGTNPIPLDDKFADLLPAEQATAREIANRLRMERMQEDKAAKTKPRPGNTAVRKTKLRAKPSRVAPHFDNGSELVEAAALVRRLKASGVDMTKILPRMRLKVP
jgi:hypothetical protein